MINPGDAFEHVMDTVALVAESLGTGAIACDETTAEVARLDQPLCVRQSWII